MKFTKGSIVDIYPASGKEFRACIVSQYKGDCDDDIIKVTNLDSGEVTHEYAENITEVVIYDIDDENTYCGQCN